MKKAFVDKNICIGCGLCEAACSSVFYIDEDNLANTYDSLDESNIDDANDALNNCPVGAIRIEDNND